MDNNTTIDVVAKRLETPAALEFSEMQILKDCLTEAWQAFDLYFKILDRPDFNSEEYQIIRMALFRDGVVQTMVCFSKNPDSRHSKLIPSEAFDGIGGWQDFYQWMHDYRDSFAAHNFGVMRQAETAAVFHPETFDLIYLGALTLAGQGKETSAQASIQSFVKQALNHVEERIAELGKVVEKEAKALSRADIENLAEAKMVLPSPKEIRTGREKYRMKQEGR